MHGTSNHNHSRSVTIVASVIISATVSSLLTVGLVDRLNGVSVRDGVRTQLTANQAEDIIVQRALSKNVPAVVSITALKSVVDSAQLSGPDADLYMPDVIGLPQTKGKVRVGGGSGFIVRKDGLIVTNAHVVNDSKAEFLVMLSDNTEHPAKVIGLDPVLDIAVIKIEKDDLPVVKFGNSDTLFVGQSVLAIGNSLATFQNSVTKGIISGLGRQVAVSDDYGGNQEIIDTAIQTDAAINPGNSGGPLINLSGEVIGVNTAVSRRGQLIGFSLPVNSVQRIIDDAVRLGRIAHPWLGVRYHLLDADMRAKFKVTQDNAAYVDAGTQKQPSIVANSPAAKSGIKEEDIILAVNNQPLDAQHTLALEIAKYSVGDTIQLTVLRAGKEMGVRVTLEEFPKQ